MARDGARLGYRCRTAPSRAWRGRSRPWFPSPFRSPLSILFLFLFGCGEQDQRILEPLLRMPVSVPSSCVVGAVRLPCALRRGVVGCGLALQIWLYILVWLPLFGALCATVQVSRSSWWCSWAQPPWVGPETETSPAAVTRELTVCCLRLDEKCSPHSSASNAAAGRSRPCTKPLLAYRTHLCRKSRPV